MNNFNIIVHSIILIYDYVYIDPSFLHFPNSIFRPTDHSSKLSKCPTTAIPCRCDFFIRFLQYLHSYYLILFDSFNLIFYPLLLLFGFYIVMIIQFNYFCEKKDSSPNLFLSYRSIIISERKFSKPFLNYRSVSFSRYRP